jgi:hypothetical protein
MKRKETLGRLLLTLLTAFVMVAGAFVAAVPANTGQDESPSMPVAVRELDGGTSEAGEAPAGATFKELEPEEQSNIMAVGNEDLPDLPQSVDPWEMEIPEEDLNNMDTSKELYLANKAEYDNGLEQESTAESAITDSDTRSATVDAGGPYGERDAPLYEGNPVNFEAQIAGDINDNYMFRWDVNDDGNCRSMGRRIDHRRFRRRQHLRRSILQWLLVLDRHLRHMGPPVHDERGNHYR